MSATYELFTRWREARGLNSDNAGALALGVTRGAVSLWKKGRNADADQVERMALDLNEDPDPWLALTMVEKTTGEASRAWLRSAKRLGAAAAMVLATGVAAWAPLPAAASDGMEASRTMHYANLRRLLAGLIEWLARSRHGHPAALLPV